MPPDPLLPPHGGYRHLRSFQVAQLVYDATTRFCDRYISKRSRTHDQMVQAARSGVQNIAEGSKASGTSKKMELKLTNVARASLEELRLDYQDFLRHRGLPEWPRDDPRRQALVDRRCQSAEEVAAWVHQIWVVERGEGGRCGLGLQNQASRAAGRLEPSTQSTASTKSTQSTSSTKSTKSTHPEIAANAVLTLLAVACALLDRQIAALAAAFEREGGFTERLYRMRSRRRRA